MRVAWFFGCLIVAFDCASMAVGASEQLLFATDHIWVWWVAVPLWINAAIGTMWAD